MAGTFLRSKYQSAPKRRYRDMRLPLSAGIAILVAGLALSACAGGAASVPSPKANQSPSSPVQASFRHLKMISETSGWALADTAGGTSVVRTDDGALDWSAVLVAHSRPMAFDFVPAVADFHSATQAWVLGYLGAHSTASNEAVSIASTSDAGRHWRAVSELTVNGQATSIQFIDALHGWVFASPSAGGVIGAQDTTLYGTVDGGVTWQISKPPSQVRGSSAVRGRLPEACAAGVLDAPSFINAQDGWIAGPCDSRLFLYASHDGGLNWTQESPPSFPAAAGEPNPPTYVTRSPRFISPEDGFLVVLRGVTTGANSLQEAAVYVTKDGGATWTAHRLPQAELHTDFVDAENGWFVGVSDVGGTLTRVLHVTRDGGQTWRAVSGPHDYFDGDLSFVSAMVGFIAAPSIRGQPGQFFKTTDGGATWGPLRAVVR